MAKKLYKETASSASFKYVDEGTQGAGFSDVNDDMSSWKETLKHMDKYSKSARTGMDYLFHIEEVRRIVLSKADLVIISSISTPPTSPSTGDKHEIIATATGDWVGKEGDIADWNGATWDYKSKEEVGFDECSAGEKVICCEYKIGTHSQRVSTVGGSNVVGFNMLFGASSYWARARRANNAMSVIDANFVKTEIQTLETQAIDNNLYDSFLVHGRYGSCCDEGDGVYDWIYGLGSFTGEGVIDRAWTPKIESSMQDLCDKINDQLVNGNQLL